MGGDDVWRLQYRNHFPPPEVRIDLTEIEKRRFAKYNTLRSTLL